MHASAISIAVFLSLSLTCAAAPDGASNPGVTPFSAGKPGAAVPPGWSEFGFGTRKPATEYTLVADGGRTVLHAHAERSSSALAHPVRIDVVRAPVLEWQWKISNVIATADNRVGSKEDAPARIVLGFDGDEAKLSLKDRTAAALAKQSSGRPLPYAQLVYIWATRAPVGAVIRHPHSDRVRMVVAASGAANAGRWISVSRNVHDDFRNAFGEEPGMLTDVGVLTDSDNTGETVDAWYGDIRFAPAGTP